MKKLLKSDIYGSINSAQIYYLQLKVNICSYCSWTVVTSLLKRMPKKKKGKTWLWDVYVDPNVLIIYNISAVWIGLKMRLCFLLLFFFFLAVNVDFLREQCTCALFTDPQKSLFNNFFIKNGSHNIIHIFKNYFVTMFSVFSFSKISSIQTKM